MILPLLGDGFKWPYPMPPTDPPPRPYPPGWPHNPDWPNPATPWEKAHHGSNINPKVKLDTSTTTSSGPPTRSDIEEWRPDVLTEHAEHWSDLAQRRETVFEQVKSDAASLDFTGVGQQGMQDAVSRHYSTAISEASELNSAAQTAQKYANDLSQQQQQILRTVSSAQQQGFSVSDTWQVTDVQSQTVQEQMLRQPVAQAIAAQLAGQVATFMAIDAAAGADLTAHAGRLAGVQMMDFKTDKGQTPTQNKSDQLKDQLHTAEDQTHRHLMDLQTRIDRMAADEYMHPGVSDGGQMPQLAQQLHTAQGRMADLTAVDKSLSAAPDTLLTSLTIPPDMGQRVMASVSVGNPDTAAATAVMVPGLGSSVTQTLPGLTREAAVLQGETSKLMGGKPAAVVAWMGYNPPGNPLRSGDLNDVIHTFGDGDARSGASALAPFLQGLHDNNPDGRLTVLGHSYGSLTSSLALEQLVAGHHQPVDNAIFYGSPGLEAMNPDAWGLKGHAYIEMSPTDPVPNLAGPLSPLHGWDADPNEGMLPHLSASDGVDPSGVFHPGTHGHSDYANIRPNGEIPMAEYNMAAIAAGKPDAVVMQPDGLPLINPPH